MSAEARLFVEDGKVVCPACSDLIGLDRCCACPRLVRIDEPPGGPVVYCNPRRQTFSDREVAPAQPGRARTSAR